MGTPAAAVPSLERLISAGHDIAAVYTQPDRPSGRGKRISMPAVKEYALGRGLSVMQPLKIKTPEALETFRSHGADAAIVVAYGRILPTAFLEMYPKGAINLHFSLLPKYRGAAPVNWAIVNGDNVSGVTTMKMDAGLDTGDILLQSETAIGSDENAVELMDRLSHLGAELLIETLDGIDSIVPRPQDESMATYAPLLHKEDGRIDWTMSAAKIVDRIRGFQPFPTSFTTFRNQRLTVWKARASNAAPPLAGSAAGTICEAAGEALKVVCGEGSIIEITELQPEGKRRMTAADFINGSRPAVGEILASE